MNFELFIARRIVFSKKSEQRISRPITRIAVLGVAVGFAVMLISVAIVTGFQKEIRDKVIGFGSHIQVTNFDENNSFETKPVPKNEKLLSAIKNIEGVKHVQVFGTKAGIIKTDEEIQGVVLKGVSNDFDWNFFQDKIKQGKHFTIQDTTRNDSVLISSNIARKLKLKAGDDLRMYFIQQPPRARKFVISGIYETGLDDFDNLYVYCDIHHIQKLNDWDSTQVAGYEVLIKDFKHLDEIGDKVYTTTGSTLNARTIKEIYPQIFSWLDLQNINAAIILILMIIVAGVNMISALLIIILERTQMIGTMKSLGAEDVGMRKIFVYVSFYLIGRGLLIGNIIGLGLCFLQKYFGIVHLDQASYYLSYVPINFSAGYFLLLNLGSFLFCALMMLVPVVIISKITPMKALRYS